MLITLQLGSGITGDFIVDTGSAWTLIADDLARRTALPSTHLFQPDGSPLIYEFTGKQFEVVTVPRLGVGSIPILKVPFVVVGRNLISTKDTAPVFGRRVDGIIGMNLLKNLAVTIDAERRTIAFDYPGKLPEAQLAAARFEPSSAVSLEMQGYEAYVSVKINRDVEDRLLIDTACQATEISPEAAKKLKLKTIDTHDVGRYSKRRTANIALASSLQIGNASIQDIKVDYFPQRNKGEPSLLGMDFLRQFTVLMDFPAGKMYLRTPDPLLVKPKQPAVEKSP